MTEEGAAPGETFGGEWLTVQGKDFYLVEKPMPIYALPLALDTVTPRVRLLRSHEIQKLKSEGFPFEQLDFIGEFWTSTRQSCSVMVVWVMTDTGITSSKGWDKTFTAWVLCVKA